MTQISTNVQMYLFTKEKQTQRTDVVTKGKSDRGRDKLGVGE